MKKNWVGANADNGQRLFLTPTEARRARKRYDQELKAAQKRRRKYGK